MQFGITTAAWSRVLSALRDSGLLSASFNSKRSLARAIKTLTIANAADLVIEDADLDLGEPFDTPAVAAVPAPFDPFTHRSRCRILLRPQGPATFSSNVSRKENKEKAVGRFDERPGLDGWCMFTRSNRPPPRQTRTRKKNRHGCAYDSRRSCTCTYVRPARGCTNPEALHVYRAIYM